MTKLKVFIISMFVFSIASTAAGETYWANYWSGEYPYPIVNVIEEVKLSSYSDYKLEKPDGHCTLARGQYHPWSKDKTLQFVHGATVTLLKTIRNKVVLKGSILKNGKLSKPSKIVIPKKSTTVKLLSYLAEGHCRLKVGNDVIATSCPSSRDFDRINKEKIDDFNEPQFFRASCKEGKKAWILANKEIFSNKEIQQGEHFGWGALKGLPEKGYTYAASFPCSKARTKTEKLICSDKSLAEQDMLLSVYYKNLLKRKPAIEGGVSIKTSQKNWLKKRNRECEKGLESCQAVQSKRWDFLEYVSYGHTPISINDNIEPVLLSFQKGNGSDLHIEFNSHDYKNKQSFKVESDFNTDMIKIVDVNFDGYKDILIPQIRTAGPNLPNMAILYSKETSKFQISKSFDMISNPEIDTRNKLITSKGRLHAAGYYKNIHKWENGNLITVLYQTNICHTIREHLKCEHTSTDRHKVKVHTKKISQKELGYFPSENEIKSMKEKFLVKEGICTVWESGDAYHLHKCYPSTETTCGDQRPDNDSNSQNLEFNLIEEWEGSAEKFCLNLEIKNARDVELTMAGQWGKVVWQNALKIGSKAQVYQSDVKLRNSPDGKDPLKILFANYTLSVGTKVKILERSKKTSTIPPLNLMSSYWFKIKVFETGKEGWVFGKHLHPNPKAKRTYIK